MKTKGAPPRPPPPLPSTHTYTHIKSHHPFSPLPPNKSNRYTNQVFFNPVTPNQITMSDISTSKIYYSLIKPQLLHCTQACGYKFHALPVHLHPIFTAPPIGGAFGVQPSICGGAFFCENSQLVKTVGCFREGTPSWMLDRILNATLPNNLSPLSHPWFTPTQHPHFLQ